LDRLVFFGLLTKHKKYLSEEPVYCLSKSALSGFSDKGTFLVSKPNPIKITWSNHDHDCRVIQLRLRFEKELKDVFWCSDFEMRSGITPKVKADFQAGKLDVMKWRYNRGMSKERLRRTPDGYFEATFGVERRAFVLEYVHCEYSERKYDEIIPRLVQRFPSAFKLLVFRSSDSAIKNIKYLRRRVRDRKGWWAGSFDKVSSLPFLEAFEDLGV
jgi:hypothetical protein